MEKTFFLDQHGCAKNQVDGELIIARLQKLGWVKTEDSQKANLIIINSCGFIKSAKEDSLNSLFIAKNTCPDAKIVFAGCLAERYANEFSKNLTEADAIFGNGDISKIDDVVNALFSENQCKNEGKASEKIVSISEQKGVCCGERTEFLNLPGSAYIKITEGCDNRCSFCAIPIIRGKLRSRPVDDIVQEIKSFLARDVFEFNLIGQDLASYGCAEGEGAEFGNFSGNYIELGKSGSINTDGESPLAYLLKQISKISGNFWVRLLYIHPDNFPLDILEVIKNDSRILPYFDIPFQSGDDEIIRKMNRHGSCKQYIELIEKIRSECAKSVYKDCAIRTTFLCGFPGETKKNAKNTQNFLAAIKSDWAGCFAYSREDDTAAYSFAHQIPMKKSQKRCDKLNEMQTQIMSQNLQRHVGKELTVLVEEILADAEEVDGLAIARAWFQAPEVDGNVVILYDLDDEKAKNAIIPGKTVLVRVDGVSGVDLYSEFLG